MSDSKDKEDLFVEEHMLLDEEESQAEPAQISEGPSVEQLDEKLLVVGPSSWILLSTIFTILVVAIVWAFWASLPLTIEGRGIVISESESITLRAPKEGQIKHIYFQAGEQVKAGDLVADIGALEASHENVSKDMPIYAPIEGKILEFTAATSDFVKLGDPIVWIDPLPTAQKSLVVQAYFPKDTDKELSKGQKAEIFFPFGKVSGTVSRLADYPIAAKSIHDLFPSGPGISTPRTNTSR